MKSQTHPMVLEEADCYALAAALATIPLPRITKDPREISKQRIEPAKHIPFDAILHRMLEANPEDERSERDCTILSTALILLHATGAVEVTENQTVAAVTEPAGYLLHSLSQFLKECTPKPHCYRPVRLDPDEEDPCRRPFLILARQAEEHRIAWAENEGTEIQPIREQKIISILIKGERTGPTTINSKEEVYLHVWKEGWNAYALIGSEQICGEHVKETAYRALKEDLEIPSDEEIVQKIRLQPSGVADSSQKKYAPTRGAYTRYRFNLLWAEEIDGDLRVEGELKPRWFTYEEICNQQARTGESIITNKELIQAINFDEVPVVITDVRPFARPISEQIRDLHKEIRDVGKPLGELTKSVGLTVLSFKWWLLLLIGIVLFVIFVLPILRELPALSPIADFLSIVGFLGWLIALIIKLHRSNK